MVYGTMVDFVTGEQIVDTDDERYRQKIARFLVEEKGYGKEDMEVRRKIETLFGGQFVVSRIDIVIKVAERRLMIIRYGPGSLVTRERPALAAARVLEPEVVIPYTIVTNGENCEVLETDSGRIISEGHETIPDRQQLLALTAGKTIPALTDDRREKELRILNAFDVEICCVGGPCALPGAEEG